MMGGNGGKGFPAASVGLDGIRMAAESVTYKLLAQGIREKKACDLLQSTELSIEEIASHVGYSDVANFYRAFKSWTGKTPLRYRGKKGTSS